MEYLLQKFTETYTWLSEYYHGEDKVKAQDITKMTPQDKIIALRKVLKSECIYTEDIQGKIQMQYSKLVHCPEYKKFCFTTQVPPQHPVPQNKPQKKMICLLGEYFLQTDKIKCPLLIHILFEENFMQTLPKFYVKLPNLPTDVEAGIKLLRTAKPSHKYVEIVKNKSLKPEVKYNFKARTDGIQVILPQRKVDWKMDVKSLLDKCIDIMKREFPFVKMKQPIMLADIEANMDSQTKNLYEQSQKLKERLQQANTRTFKSSILNSDQVEVIQDQSEYHPPQFLVTTQQLDILSRTTQSQIIYLREESSKIVRTIKEAQKDVRKFQQSKKFSSIYPVVSESDTLHKELFDIMVDHEASKDCLIEVERYVKEHDKFEHKLLDQTQFKKSLGMWQAFSQKVFFQRYRIKQIIKEIQRKQVN